MDIEEKNLVDTVLSEKIYRIFQYIEDTIKQHGDISQFKEDVLYVIHFLLERQLEPRQLTATEMVVKQREYALSKEQRKKDEEHIRLLKCELDKKDKIINEMAVTIYDYANLGKLGICTAELEDGKYNMDFCKMDLLKRSCAICIIDYFTKKAEGKI